MKIGRAAVVLLVLLLGVTPEVRRYAAERRLWQAHAALDLLAKGEPGGPDPKAVHAWVAETAVACSRDLPGDPRPWMLAASARFLDRDPLEALGHLHRAFDDGERADVDFQAGRAFVALHDMGRGQTALVRAAWISPVLLTSLPPAPRAVLEGEVRSIEGRLWAGRLAAPPPAPVWP
jgi:hypothetical protein